MSIDELGRDAARRTSGAVASTTDVEEGYQDLLHMRRRRSRTAVAFATAAVFAAAALIWAGTSESAHRHSAPAVPAPAPTASPSVARLYRVAPPLCGDYEYTQFILRQEGLGDDVRSATDVAGPCPGGPVAGRYLSVLLSVDQPEPFGFTVPADWKVSGVPSDNAGDPMPGGGGILVRSVRTGDGFAITVYPMERDPAGDRRTDLGQTARDIANWAATQHAVVASPATRTNLDGRTAWQVDFTLRAGARTLTPCIVGGGCAAVFGVRTEAAPDPGSFGILPGGQSRAVLFSATSGAPVLIWVWGHAGTDDINNPTSEIRTVLDSLDLSPKLK